MTRVRALSLLRRLCVNTFTGAIRGAACAQVPGHSSSPSIAAEDCPTAAAAAAATPAPDAETASVAGPVDGDAEDGDLVFEVRLFVVTRNRDVLHAQYDFLWRMRL